MAQIYLDQRYNFLTTDHPDYPIKIHEYYLGQDIPWKIISDPNGEFELGGSLENPIRYNYKKTGDYNFIINLVAPAWTGFTNGFAYYELFLNGNKQYYYYQGQIDNIKVMNANLVVSATQGTSTNFKLKIYISARYEEEIKYYFEGDPDTVYSSITAKFIPDLNIEENKEPLVITQDTQLTLNRRYIVNTKKNELITLKIKEEDCKLGSWLEVKNLGDGDVRIITGPNIQFAMYNKMTRERNGYLQSRDLGDFIRLECMQLSPKIMFSDTIRIGNYIMV